MHDVVGFDNHGDAQNHISNQHVDVDNNNDIVIDDLVAHEVVANQIFRFKGPQDSDFLPPVIHPMSMCYSLTGENLNDMRRR